MSGPHIVVCPYARRVLLVPREIPIASVRAAWSAFSQTKLYTIIPSSSVIQTVEQGPKEYSINGQDVWNNILVPALNYAKNSLIVPNKKPQSSPIIETFQEHNDGSNEDISYDAPDTVDTNAAAIDDTDAKDDTNVAAIADANANANIIKATKDTCYQNDNAAYNKLLDVGWSKLTKDEQDSVIQYFSLQEEHQGKTVIAAAVDQVHAVAIAITAEKEPYIIDGFVGKPATYLDKDVVKNPYFYNCSTFGNPMDSLMKAEIKDTVYERKQYAHVLVYMRQGQLSTVYLQGINNVYDFINALPKIGFPDVKVEHVFHVDTAPIVKTLFEKKCATLHDFPSIVRELYAIKKYSEPLPEPTVTSKMVKFVMTRLLNVITLDTKSEMDIDDLWTMIINTVSSQPQINPTEFVAVLRYLGHDISSNGLIRGFAEASDKNRVHQTFFAQRPSKYEKVYNLQIRPDIPIVKASVGPWNQSSAI